LFFFEQSNPKFCFIIKVKIITHFDLIKVDFITKKSNNYFYHVYLGKPTQFNLLSIQYLNTGAGGLAGAFVHEKHAYTIKPA